MNHTNVCARVFVCAHLTKLMEQRVLTQRDRIMPYAV